MANQRNAGRPGQPVEPWQLLGPLALTGAAGGALWIFIAGGVLPESQAGPGVPQLLYAWWFPGLLFGVAFTATLRFDPHAALAFSTVTGSIFFGVVGITLALAGTGLGHLPIPFAWEGMVSGALGAWLYHRTTALFLGVHLDAPAGLALGIGALLGGVLTHLIAAPEANSFAVILTSAGWGSGVGFFSYRLVAQSGSNEGRQGSVARQLRDALTAPATQVLGLAVTIASVIGLLTALL